MPPKKGPAAANKKGGAQAQQQGMSKAAAESKAVADKAAALAKAAEPVKNIPLYLTEGSTQKDRDVVIDNFFMTTPDGKTELLKGASVRLVYGRHYGLIGQNGIGKSSLLRMISNYEIPKFPQYLRVVHVHQEEIPAAEIEQTVLEYVLGSDEQKNYLEAEEERLLAALEAGADDGAGEDGADQDMGDFDELQAQLDIVYERLEKIGARSAESRARAILTGLQFTKEMQENPIRKLSGGWKMRVRLACALFVTPDILLLDEPTNHLDFPAVEWLAEFLRVYEPTLFVVSHDRGFLDQVMTDCVDFRDKTLMYYRGDYSNYLKVRAEHIKQHNRLYEKTLKKRLALHKFIMEARQKAHDDPNLAELAKTRQRVLDALPVMEKIEEDRAININFPDPGKLDHAVMSCKDMWFRYNDDTCAPETPYLLRNINVHVDLTARVGIMGANGAGKTTLIKVLLGKFPPSKGEVRDNAHARVKIFTQHHLDQLDETKTPLEFLMDAFRDKKEGYMRGFLGRFGLDNRLVEQKIGTLSGGQKSRVAFAMLTCSEPHLVIMDEPTNHLDIETIESLIKALQAFKGGVIVISHDRYFLSQIAEEFWAVDAAGDMKITYDLDEAKDFSYKPITFVIDAALKCAPGAAPAKKKKEIKEVVNDEDVRLAKLRAAFGDDDDDDDDADIADLDNAKWAKAVEDLRETIDAQDAKRDRAKNKDALVAAEPSKGGNKASAAAPAPAAKAAPPAVTAPVVSQRKYAPPPPKAPPKQTGRELGFSMLMDLDSEDEEPEPAPKPVAAKKAPAAKKAKGKKGAAPEDDDDDDDAGKFDMMAALAGGSDDEGAAQPAAKKADKKKKKAKAAAAADDEDDGDAGGFDMLAAFGGDDDEEQAAQPAKKADKKKKKAAKAVEEDDGDAGGFDMLAAFGGDDEEEAPAAPVEKKKKKKAAKAVEEEEGDAGGFDMMAAFAGDDDEAPAAPVEKKKKKKAVKASEEEEDAGGFDMMAALGGDDDEEPAAPVEKKKKKKAAKAAEAEEEAEEGGFDMMAAFGGDDEEEEAKPAKKADKKKK